MGDTPEQEGCEGDLDHGVGELDAFLIVSNGPSPSGHPGECPFDDPSAGEDVKSLCPLDPSAFRDDEVEESRLV